MKVAWIGLGAMGAPMAVRLVRSGVSVQGYDIDAAAASRVAAEGVKTASHAVDAVSDAGVVFLMVATPAQAEEVLFGKDGVAKSFTEGAILVLMATLGAECVESIAKRLGNISVVDAPVSGGVARAGTGELLIMVSGDAQSLATVEPIMRAMGTTLARVGETAGQAQKVKMVNQLLCGVHIAVAAEALAYAESLGLDAGATREVVRHGAAASCMLDDRGDRMVQPESSEVRSAIDIFVKDLGLVTGAVGNPDSLTPLARAAHALFREGSEQGFGSKDDSRLIEVYRRRAK